MQSCNERILEIIVVQRLKVFIYIQCSSISKFCRISMQTLPGEFMIITVEWRYMHSFFRMRRFVLPLDAIDDLFIAYSIFLKQF